MTTTIYTTDGEGRAVKQTVEVTEEVVLESKDKATTAIGNVLDSLNLFSEDKVSDLTTQLIEALDAQSLIVE